MKIHPTLKSILWIVVPLLLGGLGFYGLYRDTDWHELQETLRTGVNYPILLFSLLFGLMSNLCRGLRWGAPLCARSPLAKHLHAHQTPSARCLAPIR